MKKANIAICMKDALYQERFIKCLLKHYKEVYEIHSFTEELIPPKDAQRYAVFITDVSESSEALCLWFGPKEDPILVEKYQAVYKIVEKIDTHLEDKRLHPKGEGANKPIKLGVYSLDLPGMQLSYCAMLSNIYSEEKKVLLLNLMPFSGLETEGDDSCLEDLMMMANTNSYTRNRMLSSIGHTSKWDYVYSVANPEVLAEGSWQRYEEIIDMLAEELEYEVVVINFGGIFYGMLEGLESCAALFLLKPEKMLNSLRWRQFEQELERRGRLAFLHRIHAIEIPATAGGSDDYREVARKWEWSATGDYVRSKIETI